MIIKRLIILQILLAGLGGIYLLPKSQVSQQCGVNLELPEQIDLWTGKDGEISERERLTLGAGTEFARKTYTNLWGDQVLVSIVLSGRDMNQSIHRPERCLPAQNFNIQHTSQVEIPLSGSSVLTTTRLYLTQPRQLTDGRVIQVPSLNYYWFIGFDTTTPSHVEREYMDIRDGLLRGYNQRWAYVTVMANITHGLTAADHTEKETDKMLQDLIVKVAKTVEKPSVVNR